MKTYYSILILFTSIMFSCSVDYTDPQNLNGTVWRCYDFPESFSSLEYVEMRFITTDTVEIRHKNKNESPVLFRSTEYFVLDNQFSITVGGEEGVNIGTIDNSKKIISLNYYIFGKLNFKKM